MAPAMTTAIAWISTLLAIVPTSTSHVSTSEALHLRDQVKDMFYHAFNNYMEHAFPLDELRPLSCSGEDSLGGYSLTLVDSLDMLALLGDGDKFGQAVSWIGQNLHFRKNKTVSLFETTIRVLGGLLSAHLIASDPATGLNVNGYNGELLTLAEDLGHRLLPAFKTPTGIPYGSINLLEGVEEHESQITSTAGGGTLTLEFGILSRLTGNPVFEEVSRNSVRGLWAQRSQLGLLGAHINIFSGEWTHKDAGIGTSIDSFYEYLLKAYILLGEEEYLYIFKEAYKAVMKHVFNDPWYVEVNMNSAAVVWPLFNSLQAFWPGLQVLAGDIEPAVRTHKAFFSVWKKFGFTPEGFNLASLSVQPGQKSYPLRPELIESTYWLYKATRDPIYLDVGRDILASIQRGAYCPCGYCHIADVETHEQDDHMESFFLAETVKYLWLLFDLAVGGENLIEKGPYPYIFSTEGHIFPLIPEISLPSEHCTYSLGFCSKRADYSQCRHEVPGNSSFGSSNMKNSITSLNGSNSITSHRPLKGVCSINRWRQLGMHLIGDPFNEYRRKIKTVAKDGPLGSATVAKDGPLVSATENGADEVRILTVMFREEGEDNIKIGIKSGSEDGEHDLKVGGDVLQKSLRSLLDTNGGQFIRVSDIADAKKSILELLQAGGFDYVNIPLHSSKENQDTSSSLMSEEEKQGSNRENSYNIEHDGDDVNADDKDIKDISSSITGKDEKHDGGRFIRVSDIADAKKSILELLQDGGFDYVNIPLHSSKGNQDTSSSLLTEEEKQGSNGENGDNDEHDRDDVNADDKDIKDISSSVRGKDEKHAGRNAESSDSTEHDSDHIRSNDQGTEDTSASLTQKEEKYLESNGKSSDDIRHDADHVSTNDRDTRLGVS